MAREILALANIGKEDEVNVREPSLGELHRAPDEEDYSTKSSDKEEDEVLHPGSTITNELEFSQNTSYVV